jgi:hypothetical protein
MTYTKQQLDLIWQKAKKIPSLPIDLIRVDDFGSTIAYAAYGDRNSRYGWEVDHILAKSNGGTDDLPNLRPLHYKNNIMKSDN